MVISSYSPTWKGYHEEQKHSKMAIASNEDTMYNRDISLWYEESEESAEEEV